MSKLKRSSYFVEWNRLFSNNVGRPFLVAIFVFPLITLIFVEVHSVNHLKANVASLNNEIAQAITNNDAYLGKRLLNTIQTSLQLSHVRIDTNAGNFATSGKIVGPLLAAFVWNTSVPIKSQWGEEIGRVFLVGTIMPIQRTLALLFVMFSMLILWTLSRLARRFHYITSQQIEEIDEIVSVLLSGDYNASRIFSHTFKTETSQRLAEALKSFVALRDQLFEQSLQIERDVYFSKLSKQVAHDIRSPLSALNIVINTVKDFPEEKRIIIRNAAQRINDIANDLLSKAKAQSQGANESKAAMRVISKSDHENSEIILLPALVDILASEKRIQFRNLIGVQILCDFKHSFGSFISANASEISRILSNLINNSVEARINEQVEIVLAIRCFNETVVLTVVDDGVGIPEDVLANLGKMPLTFGKSESTSGNGLGVFHALEYMHSIGGQMRIASKVNEGTSIDLHFMKAPSPSWFIDCLSIPMKTEIICLDDDLTTHLIWKGRLESLGSNSAAIKLRSFTSGSEFLKYVQSIPECDRCTGRQYLIDYELIGEVYSGLDLIKKAGIRRSAVLVTSRYDEQNIKAECEALSIKLLPKALIGFLPIQVSDE